MAGIDYFFLLITAACVIICTIKGFVDSFFDKAAPVISVIAAVLFYRNFMVFLAKFIKNPLLCTVATFLSVFIIVFIIIKILQKAIGQIFENKILGPVNRMLGFAFGVVEALAIISLILFLISVQPFFDGSTLLENSIFFKIFRTILGEKYTPSWEKSATLTAAASFFHLPDIC